MADPADKKGPLEPDELVGARFRTSLRGFDQLEVRALLNRAADRIRKLESVVERLEEDLAGAVRRPARVADLDEETITAALGDETARVLRSAREAAAEIRANAESKSAELLRSAEAQAHSVRSAAEDLVAAEREKAEATGAEILEKAKAAGRKELEKGRAEGRRLVAEARSLRTRMLEDLAEKRRSGLSHLESLRAAREELLRTYASVEETVTRVTSELARADTAARTAAEEAVIDLGEPEEQMAELEEMASQERVAVDQLVPSPAEGTGTDGDEAETTDEPADDDRPRFELHEESAADSEAPDDNSVDDSARQGRRTSALRILRRATGLGKDSGEDEEAAAPEGFRKVEAAEPGGEGVRVLDAKSDEAGEAGEAADVEEQDEDQDEDQNEESDEDQDEESDEDQDEDQNVDQDEDQDVDQDEDQDVDGLFDRIRAEREEATEWARGVLEDAEGSAPVDGSADATEGDEPAEGGEGEAQQDRPAAFAARDEAVEGAEASVVRALKRTLGDEQNEVLAVVRGAKGGVPTVDDVFPAPADHRGVYAAAAAADLAALAGAGAGGGGGELDVTDLATRMASTLADPLRDRVASVLDEARGNVDGSVVDELELADRVSAVYRQWRRQRLEKVARETLREAFALGVETAAAAGGQSLHWTIDPSHPSCSPDCEDNALGGPIRPGEAFPAGGTHPPAHADCRCLALPVG